MLYYIVPWFKQVTKVGELVGRKQDELKSLEFKVVLFISIQKIELQGGQKYGGTSELLCFPQDWHILAHHLLFLCIFHLLLRVLSEKYVFLGMVNQSFHNIASPTAGLQCCAEKVRVLYESLRICKTFASPSKVQGICGEKRQLRSWKASYCSYKIYCQERIRHCRNDVRPVNRKEWS